MGRGHWRTVLVYAFNVTECRVPTKYLVWRGAIWVDGVNTDIRHRLVLEPSSGHWHAVSSINANWVTGVRVGYLIVESLEHLRVAGVLVARGHP